MANETGFEAMLSNAGTDGFKDAVKSLEDAEPIGSRLDPVSYAECFSTEAGQAVLLDMYNRYVNVTRAVPGLDADQAFFREGMASVVFDIVNKMEKAFEGE